jgi:DNA ligase-1
MSASWIHRLNESDSRLHKESIISHALTAAKVGSDNADTFLKLTKLAYNPYVTLGVRQVPETEDIIDAENPWLDFVALLDELQYRVLTGNAARDAIDTMSKRFTSDEWNNFCRNVIRKDLRAGISDKTINKICKKTEYEVPIFGCQLATNSENRPEMEGKKRIEPKLDGVRVLLTVINQKSGASATCYSRNGKVFENFSHIESQILKHYDQLRSLNPAMKNGFVLDGEVIGNTFQELMRQARRKQNVQATDSVFNVFDVIPLEEFSKGLWKTGLKDRMALLEKMRPIFDNMANVELLPHIDVDLDLAEGRNQLERYAKDCVNSGFEGIMIKDTLAPYECKRNTNWMKWKPTITVDLTVVRLEEGTGRNEGRLGALVCEGVDDGKQISVNVGSGFSDEDRDSYWASPNDIVGRTAEILCDIITQNQDGTYSLRFPRFVRFRDDK